MIIKTIVHILPKKDIDFFAAFNKKIESDYMIEPLIFDENLVEIIMNVIQYNMQKLQDMFPNNTIQEKEQASMKSAIYSIVNRFSYEKEPSIFSFITQIFLRLLTSHTLIDGNKRTAIMILRQLWISLAGFKFDWYKDSEIPCVKFVKILQGKDHSNIDAIEIKIVENWIRNQVIFSLLK